MTSAVDVDLDHLAELAFFMFLHCSVIPPASLLSVLSSVEGSHCMAHIYGVGHCAFPLCEWSMYVNYLEFCSGGLFLLPHLFIYCIISLSICP